MIAIGEKVNSLYSKIKQTNRKISLSLGEKLLRKLEKSIEQNSLVGNPTFFEPQQFNWISKLETNWLVIRQELDNILKHRDELPNFQDISQDQYSIANDNLWKTYLLYAYGVKAETNCVRCPETTRLIEQIPGMKTAFFSILLPHKHIPEHTGPYKGVIRYHLGLIVPQPEDRCRIRVGKEIRFWQEGKSLIFDDRYPHEVWNDTEGMRVVLFMDIVRPTRFPFALLNELLIRLIALSPFVRDVNVNQKKWDKRLEKLFSQKS
jgi:ornithine lipid ester-linked acyl 2-hydroxylase